MPFTESRMNQESRANQESRTIPQAPVQASGLLLFNDPHQKSTNPGRRCDRYTDAIKGKLTFLIAHANEHRLVPVCTGDLFDIPGEASNALQSWMMRLFRSCWTTPVILPGNHDMQGSLLADDDALGVIAASGTAIVPVHSGAIATYVIPDEAGNPVRVGLGGTPYGQDIPTDVTNVFRDVDGVVWLTHADLAFGGSYPGSTPLREIRGCSLATNGHMHRTKPPVECGETLWLNFGSISRTDVDCLDHEPVAMVFTPDRMDYLPIPHEKNVFNLTGRLVETVEEDDVSAQEPAEMESRFVELFQSIRLSENNRTADGTLLVEEIQRRTASGEVTPVVGRCLLDLLEEVS